MKFIFNFVLILIFPFSYSFSQVKEYPKDNIPPLDIPLILSGSFGELRTNHFHYGIDIRTNQTIGLNIRSIDDGYVSRIIVSSRNYGKAIYITHPNGYISLYAHLQSFNATINKYVKQIHYEKESFELDINIDKNILPVKKGDVIALSGNTGSSAGPHLHFEIADLKTGKSINPLLFKMPVEDNKPPVISSLRIYPANPQSKINNLNKIFKCSILKIGSDYIIKDTINISGSIYFGTEAYDLMNGGGNRNGIYATKVFADNELIYSYELESLDSCEMRDINSFIDYTEFVKFRRKIQLTKVDANNQLSIFRKIKNNGILNFNDNLVHKITYIVSDVKGNSAKLYFYLKSSTDNCSQPPPFFEKENENLFSFNVGNHFLANGIKVDLPPYSLYDSLVFKYTTSPKTTGLYSKIYRLNDAFIPVHKKFTLAIKPESLPEKLKDKAFIAQIRQDGSFTYKGGQYQDGFITTKLNLFGSFAVKIDTVPPKIAPINISNNKNLNVQNYIRIAISDYGSGIGTYRGTIDDKWILMEFDARTHCLTYYFDPKPEKGTHIFKLTVGDKVNNIATYQANFIIQ